MALIQRGLMIMATAGALAIPAHLPAPVDAGSGIPAKKIAVPTAEGYQPNQLEYYLGDSGLAYIRPGLNVKIGAITQLAAGQKPIVEVFFTDDVGQPLDRLGGQTPGVISQSFAMGRWDPATRFYVPVTGRITNGVQGPGGDQGGTWTDLEVGHAKYNFGQAIPAATDPTAGITMLLYGGRRNLTAIIGKDYIATNQTYDFRLDGKAVAVGQVWGVVANMANSCNKCHDPLGGLSNSNQFHGGLRNTAKACAVCHSNLLGAGGQAQAKIFFHKIHMGEYLPSVVAGTPYVFDGDWSTVAWPGANNTAPRDCMTCHEQSAPEKDVWKTKPGKAACGACHDDLDFTKVHGPTTNPAPPQVDDSKCASCHPADPPAGVEFDASVAGAHVVPYQSKQLKGLIATIDHVDNLAPGKSPTIYFKITQTDKTAVDGTKLTRVGPMIGNPAFSYVNTPSTNGQPLRESAATSVKFDAATGLTSFTYVGKIPADWKGTVGVSADIYRTVLLKRGDGGADISQREAAFNDVKYYSLDGSAVDERRVSVNITLCNSCHGALGLHGGSRQNTQECVICHVPNAVTGTGTAAESFSFQRMIHRIHTGEELTQPYNIGTGFSANEIRYPGDRRDCVKCHTATGYTIPLADERGAAIASVLTPNDYFTPQGPGTAACLGCHDNRDAAAHAYLNTAPFGEACASCHGAGHEYGVDKVHAR
jgi:OmcA/MtrC family decaheme c-type cytochrome